MNPLAQMNQAMEYLEEHLTEEISFERMAHIAGCSEYHFRRMFSYLAGSHWANTSAAAGWRWPGHCCGRAAR